MSKKTLTPGQKAVITKAANKKAATKKAATLSPAQKAWITIRAKQLALKPVQPSIKSKPFFIAKTVPKKVVKGVIKDGPATEAEIRGQFNTTPKIPAKVTVIDLLVKTPGRWIQGDEAVDVNGHDVGPDDPTAVKFCLIGAVSRAYGYATKAYNEAEAKLNKVIKAYSLDRFDNVIDFNDDHTTTEKDVQRVVVLADV